MPALIPTVLSLLRNPWVLLLLACAIGAAGTGWYRAKYHNLQAANATAIAEAQRKADALANELIIAQAAAMAVTKETVTVWRDKVKNDPSADSVSPAVRDALRGVHALGGR
jgi:hypothetical protein